MFNYTVEFLGTMGLILAILITAGNPVMIGAALAGLVAIGGSLSGAHFNPAVSVMALVKGDLSQSDFLGYILAQILGGLFALEIFKRFL
jgi:aquaporin Z|uniref:Major intrinsic protein n=1 Tax=viral metagenome TaxID=1070528 RepID=A0A6C0IQN2_9ZZZZ